MISYEVDPIFTPWFSDEGGYKKIDECLLRFYKLAELTTQVNSRQENLARRILSESFSENFSTLLDVMSYYTREFNQFPVTNLVRSLQDFSAHFTELTEKELFYIVSDELSIFLYSLFSLKTPRSEHKFFIRAAESLKSDSRRSKKSQPLLLQSLDANCVGSDFAQALAGAKLLAEHIGLTEESLESYVALKQHLSNFQLDIYSFPVNWLDFCEKFLVADVVHESGTSVDSVLAAYRVMKPSWSGSCSSLALSCAELS